MNQRHRFSTIEEFKKEKNIDLFERFGNKVTKRKLNLFN